MNIIETRYVKVSFNPSSNAVETIWKDFATSEEFRKTINIIYDTIRRRKPANWIVDFTRAGGVSIQDQQWFCQSVAPRIAQAGIQNIPVIASTDVFSRMYSDEANKCFNQLGINARYFRDHEAINNWLEGALHPQSEALRATKFNTIS